MSHQHTTLIIRHEGLAYYWREDAFLSLKQAQYAMECLWNRITLSPSKKWGGEAAIFFNAITKKQMEKMLDIPSGALPWIPLNHVLPYDITLPLDTTQLPALCQPTDSTSLIYNGTELFPLDLPAATFLMLTRWEDTFRPVLDQLGRPEETATFNYRQNFHDRPVLDEWALVIRAWLKQLRPDWQPQLPEFRIWMTHDMDHPVCFINIDRTIKTFARHLIRYRSPLGTLKSILSCILAKCNFRNDPYYQTTLRLMDWNEELGLKGTFFFMTAKPGPRDEGYDLTKTPYRTLLNEIQNRGHEIGWHPGFETSRNETVFEEEFSRANLFFGPRPYGIRQHYLAWKGPQSWQLLAKKGCLYDASNGYNNRCGFRSGTAHAFPCYDLENDCRLNLITRPLVIQENGLRLETDMNTISSIERVNILQKRVKNVQGELTVLVHNSYEEMDWVKTCIYGPLNKSKNGL